MLFNNIMTEHKISVTNYKKLRNKLGEFFKNQIREYKNFNRMEKRTIPRYGELVKCSLALGSLKSNLKSKIRLAEGRKKQNISITSNQKKQLNKIVSDYNTFKEQEMKDHLPNELREQIAKMNKKKQLNEKLKKNENYQKIMKIINYYGLYHNIPISEYQIIHKIVRKLKDIRKKMEEGKNMSKTINYNNDTHNTKSIIELLYNTINRNKNRHKNRRKVKNQRNLMFVNNNGEPFRPGKYENSFNNGTSQYPEMFTFNKHNLHMRTNPIQNYEVPKQNENNPFHNNEYIGGGKRYIHIKNIGKRLLRYNKSGRQYVIVKNKKKYL